ncbi:hypothetical protein [Thiocapsa sp. N5-Cardenillas]|uniref:hypothetical protein n=1 Tax=Thiocapsa sp. N5-Cardenillas TaxID=3137397 RepID=UPI0035B0F8C9
MIMAVPQTETKPGAFGQHALLVIVRHWRKRGKQRQLVAQDFVITGRSPLDVLKQARDFAAQHAMRPECAAVTILEFIEETRPIQKNGAIQLG